MTGCDEQHDMGELDFLSWIGNEDKAVRFFESRRWPNGRFCPECGSVDTYRHKSRKRYYHCKDCRKQFSCKVGTVMESSRIPGSGVAVRDVQDQRVAQGHLLAAARQGAG